MFSLISSGYRLLARPLLFRLPPESAQAVADHALKQGWLWRGLAPVFRARGAGLATDLCGLKLGNPVGLAAGYDKDCDFLPSLAAMGFGYVVGGTVTELPQPGNPKPRLLRYPGEQSLVNALGFPSRGLEYAARRLERDRSRLGGTPVVVSVSAVAADAIVRCHRRLEPLVAAVEVNISSPNTAGLRVFQEAPALADLLGRLNEGRKKPLFVKLPPYPDAGGASGPSGEEAERVMALVKTCVQEGADALTVANSRPMQDARLAVGAGGLSGKPVFADTLRMVSDVRDEAGDRLAINACGGIFTGEDAWLALQAGATTVQLLTGMVYRGPGVAKSVNRGLLRLRAAEVVGSG